MLVRLAFVIAAPVAWYFMNGWLQQYSFRVNLRADFFIITFLLSILIAWFTVEGFYY
ncbi:hypothetical protein [Chitinophaga eiseniae]|uniref:Uncharacterized protein n=1 Tax=Chitinophaga eiseniae TaxID=634771 RepID=A0A847SV72_9BACT|nr:hypothetical protein [Chitinophaga eiseniae]NLR82308.1 hypothetical protein [Chitinophaga eiseniae]